LVDVARVGGSPRRSQAAERLARRDGWGEPIEFAGRPAGANVIFRGTIWIATDRRLLEASRPRWWRKHQPAWPLQTIGYQQITAIRVRSRGGGEGPQVTTISLTLASGELQLDVAASKARALLAVLREHTGLALP
jgi:hypothetical protein